MIVDPELAGGIARWILDTPGVYATVVVECLPDDEDEWPEPAGWMVVRRGEG